MSGNARKPRWWQLYVMLPLLTALFLVEMRLRLTSTEHIIAQLGILGLIYGSVHIWLQANRRALMGLDEEHAEWRVRVYQFPPAALATPSTAQSSSGERHTARLPQVEVKGVLSTTFELEMPEKAPDVFSKSDALNKE
jgi:hypothetical protein